MVSNLPISSNEGHKAIFTSRSDFFAGLFTDHFHEAHEEKQIIEYSLPTTSATGLKALKEASSIIITYVVCYLQCPQSIWFKVFVKSSSARFSLFQAITKLEYSEFMHKCGI